MKMKLTIKLLLASYVLGVFCTGNMALANADQKKSKASVAASYVPKNMQKKGLNKKNIDKALEFLIPKDMSKKLNVIQWYLRAPQEGKEVKSGGKYQLVNMAIERALKRQKRTVAANLGFKDLTSTRYNVTLKRKKGNGALKYGDMVALKLWKYGWLKNKKQKYGISISDDDNKPHYIWKVTGGKVGTKVVTGMPFALSQLRKGNKLKEIIYCKRTYGVDLAPRGYKKCNSKWAKISGAAFGANGALSGEGLSGKISKKWKSKLCKAAVAAASTYATGQTGGTGAPAVAVAAKKALKKCNSY